MTRHEELIKRLGEARFMLYLASEAGTLDFAREWITKADELLAWVEKVLPDEFKKGAGK